MGSTDGGENHDVNYYNYVVYENIIIMFVKITRLIDPSVIVQRSSKCYKYF